MFTRVTVFVTEATCDKKSSYHTARYEESSSTSFLRLTIADHPPSVFRFFGSGRAPILVRAARSARSSPSSLAAAMQDWYRRRRVAEAGRGGASSSLVDDDDDDAATASSSSEEMIGNGGGGNAPPRVRSPRRSSPSDGGPSGRGGSDVVAVVVVGTAGAMIDVACGGGTVVPSSRGDGELDTGMPAGVDIRPHPMMQGRHRRQQPFGSSQVGGGGEGGGQAPLDREEMLIGDASENHDDDAADSLRFRLPTSVFGILAVVALSTPTSMAANNANANDDEDDDDDDDRRRVRRKERRLRRSHERLRRNHAPLQRRSVVATLAPIIMTSLASAAATTTSSAPSTTSPPFSSPSPSPSPSSPTSSPTSSVVDPSSSPPSSPTPSPTDSFPPSMLDVESYQSQYLQNLEVQEPVGEEGFVTDPPVLNETEISILEALYESYTSNFGHMLGEGGGIDTNCTIVMQQMGRVAVVDTYPTDSPTEDPSSSPVGPKDAGGMRRKATTEEEDDGGRRRRERERGGGDARFHPADDDERELQAWRTRLQIRFDVRYSTRLGRYNISDYDREFKIFIGRNLEAVGEDLNLMGIERVVEVMEVKLLAQTSSPTAVPSLAPPTRRPQKPIGNTIDEVDINSKSFMVGATAGVAVFCAVSLATVMYFRWRRRADKEEAAGRLLRDRRRDADAAARVGATTAGRGDGPSSLLGDGDDDDDDEQPQQHLMSSQIQDAGEPRISIEEEDERIRAFAGPKLILSTHHPVRQEQMQLQEEIGNDGGNGPPWTHSSSSLPDGPLGCEDLDVAVVVGTTEAIDLADSTNSNFYANLPFRDDELDTGMPVDIRPHPMMQRNRLLHSGASQGGEGGGRGGGGGGGGRQAPLDHEQMFINDASFGSSTSEDEGDGKVDLLPALRRQEDGEYDYYDDGPDLLDVLTDEFDSYKNQDLETLRNAIERSVDGVDGMVSLAMAHAYTSDPTVDGLLEWFGGEQDDGRIEASCLCDAYDWLKINEMSSSDLV